MPKADAVFEGGGVRGIAFAGAVKEAEDRDYQWEHVGGTSAGAIVAALIAANYRADEIWKIMSDLDFKLLMDTAKEDRLSRLLFFFMYLIPKIGQYAQYSLSIIKDLGIYEGNTFEQLMTDYLADKGIYTYRDVVVKGYEDDPKYRYRLRVIASDLTAGKMLILPQDIGDFGIEPDNLSVAKSIRMSMSIPIFFEPVVLPNKKTGMDHVIVDGGILSNYPIWLFDAPEGQVPEWVTLGFNLYEPLPKVDKPPDPFYPSPKEIESPVDLAKGIWNAMFSAVDKHYVSKRHWARTIPISTLGVNTTDFELDKDMKKKLFESGRSAAQSFLDKFDFEKYVQEWRQVG